MSDVQKSFTKNGHLNAFEFFCIIIWKANRAKTKIFNRLIGSEPDIEKVVFKLTSAIHSAKKDNEKLRILMFDFGFRLPMASAILAILYPENFTVYDYRVCETLDKYKNIHNIKNFEKLSTQYFEFVESVKLLAVKHGSLRDTDRFLWGKSFHAQLTSDLKQNFAKNRTALLF